MYSLKIYFCIDLMKDYIFPITFITIIVINLVKTVVS